MKKVEDCYLFIENDWRKCHLCYVTDVLDYRIFYLQMIIQSEEYDVFYDITRQPKYILKIKNECISVVSRHRSFVEGIPGFHFMFLNAMEIKGDVEIPFDPLDLYVHTSFFCEIGKVFAQLFLMIEPAPRSNPMYSHYHASVHCPKARIVEIPESDRCAITGLPCHFFEPFGARFANKLNRQKEYGIRILQYGAYFEYYSMVKLKQYFNENGITMNEKKLRKFTLSKRINELYRLNILKKEDYDIFKEVIKERNKLAHEAKPFHVLYDLEDESAMKIIRKGEYCLATLKAI